MTIEINFNVLEAVEQGRIDILNKWYEESSKKKNYDGTYTFRDKNGIRILSLADMLIQTYYNDCWSRWGDANKPLTGYPLIIKSAKNHGSVISFILEKSLDTKMTHAFGKDETAECMSKVIYEQYKEIEKLKEDKMLLKYYEKNVSELESKNSISDYLIKKNKMEELKRIEELKNVKEELEKLKKEIIKKDQIIEKYHK
jgi:hypothetical protein